MTAIRRSAWVVLAGLSALFALFGLGDLLIGVKFDETMAPGDHRADPRRDRGAERCRCRRVPQRWAWWTMWLLPGWALAVLGFNLAVGFVAGEAPPQALASAPPIAAIAAVALLVDMPRFRRTPQVVEALATD